MQIQLPWRGMPLLRQRSMSQVRRMGARRSNPAKVEQMMTLSMLRHQMPMSVESTSSFHAPPGWSHLPSQASTRHGRLTWQRHSGGGDAGEEFLKREELEDFLEQEAARQGRAWLGQLIGGAWEVRPKQALPALQMVVDDLVASGLVRPIGSVESGKPVTNYLVANRYVSGTPFPVPKKQTQKPVREAPQEEELCDFELERQRNIARNMELLKQLGLA
eukprot:CAMPEP_0181244370 /NCGR_PEP_ID=MMETSP1096-20121128/42824_1 /TAXON_ID=156174 ORGANISM="Chrysochromulina ericina, Strain CCMP281" /NCGR_SAMPLE_ID=MMETSP1096 /ASSEMBLY_ACC=CAM_ASM_000453 /LENGTH=217 /DNA_ID=CAMNT_0023340915 /DNA_START=1 /DNA_END=654 /DNA_ORIENTATION=-